ncbi:MAG: TonB-dependent receptor [Acidobacteriota bacterium]|nr:TonB-dependent receptor [Acidobacteriota bacterium]MDQ5871274.1 TonB-dependent receptor [Acidobacteriota bacterium]
MRRPLLARGARALSAFVAAAAFVLAATAQAQTDVTTSRISGTVKAVDGGALPGVTVEVKNQDTGLLMVSVTDSDGFFRALNLPTGSYTVSATLDGFHPAATENVRLLLGVPVSVNFTLQSASVAESVTVVGTVPTVEITNTSASTTIQTEEIKALPISGRDFKNLVLLTPQVRLESERGTLAISGERGINTSIMLDGVDYNNSMFGGQVGGAEGRAPLSISQESIKELTVITNGASVEFGRSGGGVVNVITKSGTNALHGSAFYYHQPQAWIANFADGREPADQEKSQYGASVGGPLMRDRLFFFGSFDKQVRSETVPIGAATLDADIFARYPELASPDTYASTQDGWVGFGRLDAQMGSSHRFMARANVVDYEGVNGTSTGQTRTESYNGLEGMRTYAYVGSYSGQFTPSLLNDLNLNYVDEETPRQDKGLGLPEIQLGVHRYGEVSFLPIVTTTTKKGIADTVTYLLQDHVFKTGVDYNYNDLSQVFKGNWRGVFIFNNEADLLAGRWSVYRQFGGLGGRTSDEGGAASLEQNELALFLQDQWFVSPKMTVTAGVRWERLDNPDDPILNPSDPNPNGSFRQTGQIPDEDKMWSPRLGISFSPDNKSVVRLSAGRFWSRTPLLLWVQPFTSNGIQATQYQIFAPTSGGVVTGPPTDPLSPAWGSAWSPVGIERINFQAVPNPVRPGVFAVDPNFRNPYTDRITLGFERELPARTAASLELTYARAKQLQRLTDLNRRYDGTTSSNGLPHYNNVAATQPYPYYGTIITSKSDAESKYYAATLQFQRHFTNNLSMNAGITWSKDRDNDSNERNFSGIQAEDYNNLDLNWGYSARDQRWKGGVSAVWDTPFWGLGISGTYVYNTGSTRNPVINADVNGDGTFTDRPTNPTTGNHFDRNSFRQLDFRSLNLRLSKAFRIGPGELTGLVECFNCTDEPNRFYPSNTWGTNGATPLAAFTRASGVGTPRTFQVAARFDF